MSTPLRVLIVEDSEDDTLLLVIELRRGGYDPVYVRVDTEEAMRQTLASEQWEVVLADYKMPHFSGPEALQVLRESGQDTPFIVVSGTVTDQQAIDMMREGASDFILKQNLLRLVPAIQRELRDAQIRRERREVQAALEASETKYRTLFNVEPDALLLTDAKTLMVLDANDAALHLYGYTLEEFRTLTIADLSTVPEQTTAATRAMHTEETYTVERFHRHKDGSLFSVEITTRLFLAEQRPLIIAAIRDITERKRAQEALEREQAFLSSAIELLPFPVIFSTPDGEVLRANQASYRFFGDMSPASWWKRELLTADSRSPIPLDQWPMMRAARGEVVPPTEGILVLPNHREVPVLAVAAPVYVGGTLVATVVSFTDISPLKEADRAKNRFLAVLSHELRTPLTNILGWVKEAQEAPGVIPEALRIIQRNAESQRRMLENLLEVSRLLHGKLDLKREPIDLWQLTVDAVQAMMPEAYERKVTIDLIPPGQDLPVFADRKRMKLVIGNIMDNALRFTEAGGRVTIRGYREGDMAAISFQDTGRGIPAEMKSRIFELFHTLPEVEQTGGGLGLGLPLVRAILERHGGWITVFSAGSGLGTTVTIAVPLEEKQSGGCKGRGRTMG